MSKYGKNSTIGQQIQSALVRAGNNTQWRNGMAALDLLEGDTSSIDAVWVTTLDEYFDPTVVDAYNSTCEGVGGWEGGGGLCMLMMLFAP